jgi:molybdopterin molybdotransferase
MSSGPSPDEILSFEDARHCVETQAARIQPPASESVELLQAVRRVLAEPIVADRDFPPFRRATRDGYAVRAADVGTLPARLKIIGEIKAGSDPQLTLAPGQAAAIMTGAPAPVGSDAVVMVEHTSLRRDAVEITRAVKASDNIVPAGAEAKRGACLVNEGVRIDHAVLAAAASVGMTRLKVYRRPRVAVLATGDEVVDVAKTPGPSQIRNSNSYSLAAQVETAGGDAVVLPVAPDEPEGLRKLIERGLEADLLLLSGGVSAGKYDLVEQVLEEFNAEFLIRGAWIQPGKPVVFGRAATSLGEKYFFGLPGNPLSTMVTFDLFARPMIEALGGQKLRKLAFFSARLKTAIKTKTGLKRFLPAIFSGEFEDTEVELAGWQGSGDIATMTRANCYVVVPPNEEIIEAGKWVAILPR